MTKFEKIEVKEQVSIGSLITDRRKAGGMTQRQLADRAGVNLNTLKSYETGRTSPTVANVRAIAQVLGISQKDIWTEVDSPEDIRSNASGAALNIDALSYDSAMALFQKLAAKVGEPIEPTGEDPIDVLRDVVAERGLRGKRTIAAVLTALEYLNELDADELDDVADDANIYIDSDELRDVADDNDTVVERFMTARIIVTILYGHDIVAQDREAASAFDILEDVPVPEGIPEISKEWSFILTSKLGKDVIRAYSPVLLLELVKIRKAPSLEELAPTEK